MSKRKTKFVGAYVPEMTWRKLKLMAEAQERPLSYILEKILAAGVKHLAGEPHSQAA